MNAFHDWLASESTSLYPSQRYLLNCNNATGIPVQEDTFDRCLLAFEDLMQTYSIFGRDGVVKIILVRYQSRVRYDSPFEVLRDEWRLVEHWMSDQVKIAPPGANGMYSSSEDYWWYDTSRSTLQSA
jgi:hypothetical protein